MDTPSALCADDLSATAVTSEEVEVVVLSGPAETVSLPAPLAGDPDSSAAEIRCQQSDSLAPHRLKQGGSDDSAGVAGSSDEFPTLFQFLFGKQAAPLA